MPLDQSGELAAMELANLLITYWVWIGRLIPHVPRVVHQSREMLAGPKAVEHGTDLEHGAAQARRAGNRGARAQVYGAVVAAVWVSGLPACGGPSRPGPAS